MTCSAWPLQMYIDYPSYTYYHSSNKTRYALITLHTSTYTLHSSNMDHCAKKQLETNLSLSLLFFFLKEESRGRREFLHYPYNHLNFPVHLPGQNSCVRQDLKGLISIILPELLLVVKCYCTLLLPWTFSFSPLLIANISFL